MRFFRRGDRAHGEPGTEKPDSYAVYLGLRGIPLGHAGDHGTPLEGTTVIAVILDWGQASGAATIAAMADGTTSLYTSTGGGVLGAGDHAPVRDANRRLLQIAHEHLDEFAPTGEAAIPPRGRLALVIRTTDGLRRAEASYDELERGAAPGQAVFDAANDVTTAIRVLSQDR